MAELTVRQLVVLQVVMDHGPLSAKHVVDHVRDRCPCLHCEGVGSVFNAAGCAHCYGHGHAPFTYTDSYRTLRSLAGRGELVAVRDEDARVLWYPSLSRLARSLAERKALASRPD